MLSTLLMTEVLAFQNKLEMKQWVSALKGGNSCGAHADFLLCV